MDDKPHKMIINFTEAFLADCTEARGYTEEEANRLFRDVGQDFIEEMIDDMWTNWSEFFPIGEKR